MNTTHLKRAGDGAYATADGRYEIQNPHRMYPPDPDRHWYIVCPPGTTRPDPANTLCGPFDTLRECREFLTGLSSSGA